MSATKNEPMPEGNGEEVLPELIEDLESRASVGEEKYGERLTTQNERNALVDAYQEALDLAMYLKQEIMERESKYQIKR